jgi:GTP diphosphokinase / guanosine-3',5'-bis(diphosphate) 3'-diphosphatase
MRLTLREQLLLSPQVAARAHQHQKRKDGTPYVAHPMRVAIRVASSIGQFDEAMNIEARIVAFLHDVVEDTDVSFDDLRDLGFSESIIHSVDAVTKRPGEKYADFIARCKTGGPIAIAVKLADIEDNMEDQSALDPDEAAFLTKRYTRAKEILNG